jgi:hypothetical protein
VPAVFSLFHRARSAAGSTTTSERHQPVHQ